MTHPVLTSRIVSVVFSDRGNQRQYAYYTQDATIVVGDLVLVVVGSSRDDGVYLTLPGKAGPVAMDTPWAQPGQDLEIEIIDEGAKWGDARPTRKQLAALPPAPPAPPAPPMPPQTLGTPKVVRVVSVDETVEAIEQVREWIVCKLDFAEYLSRRETEEKRALLVAKIKRVSEDAKAALQLDDLAERSPLLKDLLDELKQLA